MLQEISKEEFITMIINDVKENEEDARQGAKSPYFLLNYGGSYIGLMRKFGFTEKKAKFIEQSHKELFTFYYKYVEDKLFEAKSTGYLTLAFGLRLRTVKLNIGRSGGVPQYQLEQEERSAGNALFQSYGLITLNALANIMNEVWEHKEYFDRIVPVTTIYDSLYFEMDNDLAQLAWFNEVVVRHMLDITQVPELEHDIISLGADVEVLYPDWATKIKIPNNGTEKEILACINAKKPKD